MHARHAYTNRPDPTKAAQNGYHDHRHRRLTWDLVERLRAEYRPHVMGHGQAALAARYGLDQSLVRRVVLYMTWKGPRPTTAWDVFSGHGPRDVSG